MFINFGVLLGYVSNYAFYKLPTRLGWRFMLGIGVFPSAFLILIVLVMPESPRWLVLQGRLADAHRVLRRTSDSLDDAHHRLADIKQAAGIPPDYTDDVVLLPKRSRRGAGVWKDLFLRPTPPVRHILISAIGIHFFQQASGIDAVVLYSPRIFDQAGITSSGQKLLATMAVGFSKTSFILVATFLLDKIGRRPLLLASVSGKIASLTALGFGLLIVNRTEGKARWAVGLCIAAVLSDVGFFSIGMGPIAWVYSSEIFPLKLRAQGASVGVIVNRMTSGVVGMTFISLYKAITISGAFFLFAGIAAVSWLFFYFVLPETHGRSLEEIEGLFGNLLWKFYPKEKKESGDDAEKDKGEIELGSNGVA